MLPSDRDLTDRRRPMMLRVCWLIVDPHQFGELSHTVARRELAAIAEGLQATVVGSPRFRTSAGYLVCEAPAIPRLPVGVVR